jgi:hypothetical protein
MQALLESAEAHPKIVEQVLVHLNSGGVSASKLLPRFAGNLRESGRLQFALAVSAIYGAISCFGVLGTVGVLWQLRKEVKRAGTKEEKAVSNV